MGYEPHPSGIKTAAGGRIYIEATALSGGIRIDTPNGGTCLVSRAHIPALLSAFRAAADYLGIEETF